MYKNVGLGNVTNDAQQKAADKAAVADIRTATNDAKHLTSLGLSSAHAFITLTDGATVNWNTQNGFNAKVIRQRMLV